MKDSMTKLKEHSVTMTLFFLFLTIVPLIIMGLLYAYDGGYTGYKKYIYYGFIIVLHLIQYILTIMTLSYSLPEDYSTNKKAYLYSKVTFLFISIIFTLIYSISNLSTKDIQNIRANKSECDNRINKKSEEHKEALKKVEKRLKDCNKSPVAAAASVVAVTAIKKKQT